jgi:hypothetical protein
LRKRVFAGENAVPAERGEERNERYDYIFGRLYICNLWSSGYGSLRRLARAPQVGQLRILHPFAPRRPLPTLPPFHDTLSHHVMALPGKSALGLAIAVSPMGVSIAYHPPLLPMRFSGGSPIKSAIIPQKISLANSLASAHGDHGGHRGRISHGGHGDSREKNFTQRARRKTTEEFSLLCRYLLYIRNLFHIYVVKRMIENSLLNQRKKLISV